jgi:hypothetical protein
MHAEVATRAGNLQIDPLWGGLNGEKCGHSVAHKRTTVSSAAGITQLAAFGAAGTLVVWRAAFLNLLLSWTTLYFTHYCLGTYGGWV